jgi:hypothetical protein
MSDFFTPKKLHFKISEIKKSEGVYCCAYSCKNNPVGKKKGLCHKHYSIYRRILDPVYDRYVNFKGNALRRKKEFTITLEQFREYCNKTGYIIKKGMRGRNCSLDRIRNWEGYHIDNIQIKTAVANTKKYHNEDKYYCDLPETDEDYTPF